MKLFSLLASFTAFALVGCNTVKVEYQTKPNDKPPAMEFVKVHPSTVDKSDVDFTKFSGINFPNGKGSMSEYHAPNGLNLVMDVQPYFGDLDDLVYMISAQTGYKYLPFSGLKVTPVFVTYEARGKTALEIFVEINNKIGRNATIKISEVAQTVQVIYPISTQTFQ